jgi:hypothetical protein
MNVWVKRLKAAAILVGVLLGFGYLLVEGPRMFDKDALNNSNLRPATAW